MKVQVEVDLRTALGPVRDQGPRLTCLSHATSVAHEHSRKSVIPLSPEYLHFFATRNGSKGGSTVTGMVSALKKHGQSLETDCPYQTTDPPVTWAPPGGLTVFRRDANLKKSNVEAIELAVLAGVIPVIGIQLPEPFFNPIPPWVIPSTGLILGLHAVAAIGIGTYKGKKAILIRNSWGTDWGDDGHAWLSSDFLTKYLQMVFVLTNEVL